MYNNGEGGNHPIRHHNGPLAYVGSTPDHRVNLT